MPDEEHGYDITQEDQRIIDTGDMARRQQAPIKDQAEALELLLRPQAIRGSLYHHYLNKNTSTTKIKKEDLPTMLLFRSCISDALYMEKMGWIKSDIAEDLATAYDEWLGGNRSIDGWFMDKISKQTISLEKMERKEPKSVIRGV